MSAENGLYRVGFETRLGAGAGVVAVRDGQMYGGDSMMFYRGTYRVEAGDRFKAEIETNAHTNVPGMASVFGRAVVHATLEGTMSADRTVLHLVGTAKEAPGVEFSATLKRLFSIA